MACPEKEKLVAYLHDTLDEKESREMKAHLEECVDCNAFLLDLKKASVYLAETTGGRIDGCPPLAVLKTYLSGSLAEEKKKKIEKHLSSCNACTAELATLHEAASAKKVKTGLSLNDIQALIDEYPATNAPSAPVNGGEVLKEKFSGLPNIYKTALGAVAALFVIVVLLYLVFGGGNVQPENTDTTDLGMAGTDRSSQRDDTRSTSPVNRREVERRNRLDFSNNRSNRESEPVKSRVPSAPSVVKKDSTGGLFEEDSDSSSAFEEAFRENSGSSGYSPPGSNDDGSDFGLESDKDKSDAPPPPPPPSSSVAEKASKKNEGAGEEPPSKTAAKASEEKKPLKPLACLSVFEGLQVKGEKDEDWKDFVDKMNLDENTEVMSSRREGYFFINEKVAVQMDARTQLKLLNEGGKPVWAIEKGELFVEAPDMDDPMLFKIGDAKVRVRDCSVHMQGGKTGYVVSADGGCAVEQAGKSVTVPKGNLLMLREGSGDPGKPREKHGDLVPSWTDESNLAHKVLGGRVKVREGVCLIQYPLRDEKEFRDFIPMDDSVKMVKEKHLLEFDMENYTIAGLTYRPKLKKGCDFKLQYYVSVSEKGAAHIWMLGTDNYWHEDEGTTAAGIYPSPFAKKWQNRQNAIPNASMFFVEGENKGEKQVYLPAGRAQKVQLEYENGKVDWNRMFNGEVSNTDKGVNNFTMSFYGIGKGYVGKIEIQCELDGEWLKNEVLGKNKEPEDRFMEEMKKRLGKQRDRKDWGRDEDEEKDGEAGQEEEDGDRDRPRRWPRGRRR